MTTLRVYPQTEPLRGAVTVPGDKSMSHRAVILGALADGVSTVHGWLPAGDTQATLDAMREMGVAIEAEAVGEQSWRLEIRGRGLEGLREPAGALDCRNAGTCLRLLAGVLAGQSFASTLDGSEQLRRRPMGRIVEPLRQMGAQITSREGRAPLEIRPARLEGITYRMPVASAQVKSAILLAGLYANGDTRVYQPGPARDHTERMLQAMGAPLTVEANWITLAGAEAGERRLAPLDLVVPADISSAAFPLVAAALIPHSEVTVHKAGLNETRTGLLSLLREMGASLTTANEGTTAGERAGDLTARFDELHGAAAGGEIVVRAIDEFPIWAVATTQAAGASTLRDAAELRVKEVDRISVLAGELRRMGAVVTEREDGFTIEGPVRLQGADVDSHGDHRLGMALAVAGLAAAGPTHVRDAGCIADSFPGFVETMQALGARMEWVTEE